MADPLPSVYLEPTPSANPPANLNVALAADKSPEASAEAIQLARRFNVPVDVAANSPELLRDKAFTQDTQQLLERAPHTQSWVAKDPAHAAVAKDSMPHLAAIEGTIQSAPAPRAWSGWGGDLSLDDIVQAGKIYAKTAGAGFLKAAGGAVSMEGSMLNFSLPNLAMKALGLHAPADILEKAGSQTQDLGAKVSPISGVKSRVARGLLSGVESLPTTALSVVGSAAGGPAVGLTIAGASQGGQSFKQARDAGMGILTSSAFGAVQGGIEAAGEAVSLPYLVNNLGKVGLGEFFTHLLGKELIGENATQLAQNAVEQAVLHPELTVGDYVRSIPGTILDTSLAVAAMSSTTAGLHMALHAGVKGAQQRAQAQADVERTNATKEFLDNLAGLAEKTPLRERDPQTFQEFVDHAAQEAPVTDVYVDAKAFGEALQQSGMEPAVALANLPSVAEQYQQAAQTGGDIRIPVSEFATHIAGTDLAPALIPHLRVDPGDISQAQAKDHLEQAAKDMQASAESLMQSAQQEDQHRASRDLVQQQFLDKLTAANRFTPDVNRSYAMLVSNMYAVLGGRIGMTPEEAAARYPLEVQAQGTQGTKAVLGQEEPLQGLPKTALGPFGPAREIARRYAEQTGAPYTPPAQYAKVDVERATRIAAEFEKMAHAPNDPTVKAAYQAMIAETLAQWRHIKNTGLKVEFIDGEDPYGSNPFNAIRDVRENNHLWVYPTDTGFGKEGDNFPGNPLLAVVPGETISGKQVRANDIFRIVHDYFGHIKEGVGFRAGGEENAWRSHSAMYSPLARRAMTTETRGQNSWLNYGPHGEHNRTAKTEDTIFADQKIGLMPEWVSEEGAGDVKAAGWTASHVQALIDAEEARIAERKANGFPGPVSPAYATVMTPDQFLNLLLVPEAIDETVRRSTGFDAERAAKASAAEEIFLTVNEQGAVTGHGGRHRVAALKRDGFEALPVLIRTANRAKLPLTQGTKVTPQSSRHPVEHGTMPVNVGRLIEIRQSNKAELEGMIADQTPTVLYQDEPIFYSALARVVDNAKMNKAPAAQWKSTLQNAAGVKQEELEWTGILDLLDITDGTLTKDQLVEALQKGGIQVEEKVLGEEPSGIELEAQTLNVMDVYLEGQRDRGIWDDLSDEDREEAEADYINSRYSAVEAEARNQLKEELGTQFETYTSNGGSDSYRELLLTLPIGKGGNPERAPATHWDQPGVVAHLRFQEKRTADGKRVLFIEEVQSDWHQKGRDQGYAQPVSEEGIAAAQAKLAAARETLHSARMNVINTYLEGGGVLPYTIDISTAQGMVLAPKLAYKHGLASTPEGAALIDKMDTAQAAYNLAGREYAVAIGAAHSGIPDAPFRTSWPALVMKRAIRWAVDHGYSHIAWTTGEEQADRYNLSEAVGHIKATPTDTGRYTVEIANYRAQETLISNKLAERATDRGLASNTLWMTEAQLKEAFGANIAQRIVDRQATPEYQTARRRYDAALAAMQHFQAQEDDNLLAELQDITATLVDEDAFIDAKVELRNAKQDLAITLEGNDLSVGGEGMKAFYDRNLVNITNDLIKKHGAKVGKIELPNERAVAAQTAITQQEARLVRYREDMARGRWNVTEADIGELEDYIENAKDILKERGDLTQAKHGFEITPKLAEVASHGFPLFQNQKAPLGQISFGGDITQNAPVIHLLRGANLSTFIHETGHFFLEVMNHVASQPDAPKAITDDMDAIFRWFGIEGGQNQWNHMSFEEKRPYHEQFARGFEARLFEGSVPNPELRSIFSRFRDWLKAVYKSLVNLNVTLTPEVRGVFDRMLASDAEIKQAEEEAAFAPVYTTKPEAMSDAEWTSYQELGKQATEAAVGELETRSLRDMRWTQRAESIALKAQQKAVAAKRKAMEAQVRPQVEAQPVYRALDFLKKGLLNGEPVEGPTKMLIEEIDALYEDKPVLYRDEVKKALGYGKYGMLAKENGIHPEQVAELFGFSSADEMIQRLLVADPIDKAVEAETDQKMLETYGDITSPEALQEAVAGALHNEVRGRFVATELAAAQGAVGNANVLAKAAKAFATGMIERLRIRNIRPAQYEAAGRRAAKAALKALAKPAEFASEKRNQLVNFYASKAAVDGLEEVSKALRYFAKFQNEGTRKAIDPDYRDQIDSLLEGFQLKPGVSQAELRRRKSYAAWVETQRDRGFEPIVDEELLAKAGQTDYRELTIGELRGLRDTIRNIEHLGRLKTKLLKAKGDRELATAVDAMTGSIRGNAYKTVEAPLNDRNLMERIKNGTDEFLAMHEKLAMVARKMDAAKDGGAVWEHLIRPINEAGDDEALRTEKATIALQEIFKLVQKENTSKRVYEPAINRSISLETRLMIALNWGNETNQQRVMGGDNWTEQQVAAILKPLTATHWDFVEGIWQHIDSYWPDIAAKERRVSGVVPEKVEAAPFSIVLPDGSTRQLSGGYFPIKYDPDLSTKAEADTEAEVAKQLARGLYTRAQTRRGHTKARVETVNRPVKKSFGVILGHVQQVIHDLAWHETLIDANRLMRASDVDSAIREHYGPNTRKWMSNALADIAVGSVPATNAWERGINYLRTGATVAGLGWNITTALFQPLGLTQSMQRIGSKWVFKGISRVFADAASMQRTSTWVTERSSMMRLRAKTQMREISEIRNQVSNKSGIRSAVEDSFFTMITKCQLMADIPTWVGQYEKSMAAGETEDRAAALADQAVLDSQGGGQIKDLSGIQRGSPLMKLWTNFYSYFNVTQNLIAVSVAQARRGGLKATPALAVDVFLLTMLPSFLTTLLHGATRGLGGADPDDWFKQMLADYFSYDAGLLIGVREIGAAFTGSAGYRGPAGARIFGDVTNLAKQAEQGTLDAALLEAVNDTAGVLFHYPAGQVDRTVKGLYAWANGDAGPMAPLVGPPPKKH